MKPIYKICSLLLIISCTGQSQTNLGYTTNTSSQYFTSDIPVVDFEGLKEIVENNNNKLLVVNFWATWCKPCIEELPELMEVNEKYKEEPDYKMILVSLDQVKNMEGIMKFLEETRVDTEVYLLDDIKNMNTWIPETDLSWSGVIPATVFYNRGEKIHFRGGVIEKTKLDSIISNNYKL